MKHILENKANKLFIILAGLFIANALIAEVIGVKVFSLEQSLGIDPAQIFVFGQGPFSFNLTAGVLLWPVVFVMTDVINEYFGVRGVRRLSYLAIVLIAYAFLMFFMAIHLSPADFWVTSHIDPSLDEASKATIHEKVSDYNYAFKIVFGQGNWIIIGSLIAFLVGQVLDAFVFRKIKKWTGEKKVWLRATGSTLISQFVDSFMVLYIAFVIGGNWTLKTFLAVGLINYTYKFFMAILLTPLIYLAHYIIDHYLGADLAHRLKLNAMNEKGSE